MEHTVTRWHYRNTITAGELEQTSSTMMQHLRVGNVKRSLLPT